MVTEVSVVVTAGTMATTVVSEVDTMTDSDTVEVRVLKRVNKLNRTLFAYYIMKPLSDCSNVRRYSKYSIFKLKCCQCF